VREAFQQPEGCETGPRSLSSSGRYLHHPCARGVVEEVRDRRSGTRARDSEDRRHLLSKRWTDATLAGYQSPQTAADVREFIAELPDSYPPRLRWVLQSSADALFRAAKILHQ
jgi:hypothetical protein